MDISTMADLFGHPGIDPRQWVSYGQVDQDTAGDHSVNFNDEDGNPLPQGVLVVVTLQPSGITLPCRVGSMTGGSGEGEYSPFGPGDEVLVAIPDGDEKNGGVIIARFNNVHDAFPATVGGMDVTNNSITFRRLKTPYVLETAGAYLVRHAKTGASFSIDPIGNIILADGEGNVLSLTSSILALQDSSGTAQIQIDPAQHTVALSAGGSSLQLADAGGIFQTAGTFQIETSGVGATGHAVSAESLAVSLEALLLSIGSTIPGPLTGAGIAAAAIVIVNKAILLTTVLPVTPLVSVSVALAFPPDPTGTIPGFGKPGLLI